MMNPLRFLLATIILLNVMANPASKVEAEPRYTYRYVVPSGSTNSTTCGILEPCDLRYAIDVVANAGDIIIVHSGTYYSTLMSIDLIFINKSLSLIGSCEFDSITPFYCNPEAQSSILDAQTAKRVIRVEGTGSEEVHIEGFTIMRGIGTGMVPCYGLFDGCGAGIHASNIEKLTLQNNYIWANKAGITSGVGGGLFAEYINFLDVKDNIFIFNQATETGMGGGGAAFVFNSGGPHAVTFDHNTIYGNETSTENDSGSAGAGLLMTSSNNVQILNNTFEYQNTIHQNAGLRGSALHISDITGFAVEGNTFNANYGSSAAQIGFESDGWISKNKWWNNQVFYNLELAGDVQADIFNNFLGRQMLTTSSRGGGSTNIYLHSNSIDGYNDIRIYFNTIAAATYGIVAGEYSYVEITNNIFTELVDSIFLSPSYIIYYCDNNLFFNNDSNSIPGTNPIYANPNLVDVANGDFHLLPGSGAIDKASACDFDQDIDGDFRPIGSAPTPYDVGADEFQYKIYLPLIMR